MAFLDTHLAEALMIIGVIALIVEVAVHGYEYLCITVF